MAKAPCSCVATREPGTPTAQRRRDSSSAALRPSHLAACPGRIIATEQGSGTNPELHFLAAPAPCGTDGATAPACRLLRTRCLQSVAATRTPSPRAPTGAGRRKGLRKGIGRASPSCGLFLNPETALADVCSNPGARSACGAQLPEGRMCAAGVKPDFGSNPPWSKTIRRWPPAGGPWRVPAPAPAPGRDKRRRRAAAGPRVWTGANAQQS
jgi:hypothetical protein